MTDPVLILIADPIDTGAWRWARVGADGRLIASSTGDSASLPGKGDERVVLVLAGEAVRGRRIDLPAKTDAQARAALPYLLGDELGDNARSLHFVLDAAGAGERTVYWTEAAPLAARLAALEARDLTPDLITADFIALPDTITPYALADGARAIRVAPEPTEGYAADLSLLSLLDPDLPAEALMPVRLDGLASRLAEGIARYSGPDFRQGAFAPRRAWGEVWLVWQRAAWLALALLVLAGVVVLAEGFKARSLADETDAATQVALREAFPDVRSLPHLQSRLKALRGTGADPFLALSARLFAAAETVDGMMVNGLRFDRNEGRLSAAISAASFGDIERLKAAVAERGATLTEGASRQEDGRIISEITIGDRP
ncbi:type II secretion system protein GspL [Pseudokordiimonas caeni]|uniref:type II secretion system protein GspL n=1 Tax=Pseudokordiimonas caeni TaxID=2997908 RepID=UPI002810BE40|nr:type II secretion system protein GspL [Pseudokordiimonas caeni]